MNRLAPKSTFNESRTASLTIFYDGTVNVTDNVPADKVNCFLCVWYFPVVLLG